MSRDRPNRQVVTYIIINELWEICEKLNHILLIKGEEMRVVWFLWVREQTIGQKFVLKFVKLYIDSLGGV